MSVNQATIIESLENICTNVDQEEFIYDFMDAFGFPKSTITRLRNKDDGRNIGVDGDVGIKKRLYFRAISDDSDIHEESEVLKNSEFIKKHDIRFVIITNFKTLIAYDLKADEVLDTQINELHKQYGFFLPLAGYEKAIMFSEHPADLKASEKMRQLLS